MGNDFQTELFRHLSGNSLFTAMYTTWSLPGSYLGTGGFLDAFFEPGGKLIVHYDPSKGIYFPTDAHAAEQHEVGFERGSLMK